MRFVPVLTRRTPRNTIDDEPRYTETDFQWQLELDYEWFSLKEHEHVENCHDYFI